ncbi:MULTISPECIES: RNA polymerase sigma factor [unclassified Solwaraspora]|uniref:RNA polymerase sigma factor n=1 Tax=unclassified Solwaraspora TaxID=2627926 RepID=UPI00259BAF92|nr:DUF6596 domain-containing protein [Solwaraspora sp. WMMA2056]WJK44016.1 sigma factor-like helix-turn-helix DNA-binding protein [Solwaraspora sp. WMMA2056]
MEQLLRRLVPPLIRILVHRHGNFDSCEDAVQEALLAAAVQWPEQGLPDNPMSWLLTVATRRLIDAHRSEVSRQRRETTVAVLTRPEDLVVSSPDVSDRVDRDDTLLLLFLCCHPQLSTASQIALTLRAVGGLSTAQIARAFLVPEATMAQRISRAKQRMKADEVSFSLPPRHEWAQRLGAVLHVLYLVFNEGYSLATEDDPQPALLTREAMRLTEELYRRLPDDGEVAGLLALMLLTEARRPARTGPDGVLVPLADQDRSRWNQEYLTRGRRIVTRVLSTAPIGPYQLQAAIAAVHADAARSQDTDWRQIVLLYQLLVAIWPNPVVRLNQAIAVAMVRGPQAGLDVLAAVEADRRMTANHRIDAVRAHLLEMAGDRAAARSAYLVAAQRTGNAAERRYLQECAARLTGR